MVKTVIKILAIVKLMKYQVIKFEHQPSHGYRWLKIGDKIYKPVTVFDAENCIAIESDDDISGIGYIEFLKNI